MTDIKQLKDNDGQLFFPITHIDAVFDSEGKRYFESSLKEKAAELESLKTAETRRFENITKTQYDAISGYASNFHIKGKTICNCVTATYRLDPNGSDGIIRTRINPISDQFKHNNRLSRGTFTLVNRTNKRVGFVGVDRNGNWNFWEPVEAFSKKVVHMDGSKTICGVDYSPEHGWTKDDLSIYNMINVMILEGDHSDIDPLIYINGLDNVGGAGYVQSSSSFTPHIEILNKGEEIDLSHLTFSQGYVDGKTGEYMYANEESVPWEYSNEYVEIPNDHNFILEANGHAAFYDSNKNLIPNSYDSYINTACCYDYLYDRKLESVGLIDSKNISKQGFGNVVIRPPKNAKYIRINKNKSTPKVKMWNKYSATFYRTELRSLPNGICDEIVGTHGQYYLIQRCEEVLLSHVDPQYYHIGTSRTNTIDHVIFLKDLKNISKSITPKVHVYCDNLRPISLDEATVHGAGWTLDEEYITQENNNVIISLDRDKVNAQNAESLNNWLSQNPIRIIYELETPLIKEILNLAVETFNGTNEIMINSGPIQANMSFDITTNLGSKIESLSNIANSLQSLSTYTMHQLKYLEDFANANSTAINATYNSLRDYTTANVNYLQNQIDSRNQFAKLSEYNGTVIRINDGIDLDTVTGTGFYNFYSPQAYNGPNIDANYIWFYLEVFQHSNFGYVYQRATSLNHVGEIICYNRQRWGDLGWSAWSRL